MDIDTSNVAKDTPPAERPSLSSEELRSAISALARDVVDAAIHWRLHCGLLDAMGKWPSVAPQANTFWFLTLQAHIKVSVLAACRVFDQEKRSLHLLSLLELIQENLPLFEEPNFRTRLRDNPFVESLAKSAGTPDPVQLKRDITLCSTQDELVRRLMIHRNNAVAHLSKKRSLKTAPRKIGVETPTSEEFEILLSRAREILNRYSGLFQAEHFSTQVVGHDDYETVFRWIHERVEAERASRRKALARSRERPKLSTRHPNLKK